MAVEPAAHLQHFAPSYSNILTIRHLRICLDLKKTLC